MSPTTSKVEELRKEVKILLELDSIDEADEDVIQDKLIDKIITNVYKHLAVTLAKINPKIKDVPSELDFIVEEVSIRRYNRVGSEGMVEDKVEGHTVKFYPLSDEFVPYLDILDSYKEADDGEKVKGRVLLI